MDLNKVQSAETTEVRLDEKIKGFSHEKMAAEQQ